MEDDDSELYDAAIEKFANDQPVAAYGDLERTQQIVDVGNLVTPNAILAACYTGYERTLKILLSTRPDPDVRLAGAGSYS